MRQAQPLRTVARCRFSRPVQSTALSRFLCRADCLIRAAAPARSTPAPISRTPPLMRAALKAPPQMQPVSSASRPGDRSRKTHAKPARTCAASSTQDFANQELARLQGQVKGPAHLRATFFGRSMVWQSFQRERRYRCLTAPDVTPRRWSPCQGWDQIPRTCPWDHCRAAGIPPAACRRRAGVRRRPRPERVPAQVAASEKRRVSGKGDRFRGTIREPRRLSGHGALAVESEL